MTTHTLLDGSLLRLIHDKLLEILLVAVRELRQINVLATRQCIHLDWASRVLSKGALDASEG